MTKFNVVGHVYVVTSDILLKDIQLLEECNPEALYLMENKNGEEHPVFRLTTGCKPSASPNGVAFTNTTLDPQGCATYTECIPCGIKDADEAKEYIAKKWAAIKPRLEEIAPQIAAEADKIKSTRQALADSIEIAGQVTEA